MSASVRMAVCRTVKDIAKPPSLVRCIKYGACLRYRKWLCVDQSKSHLRIWPVYKVHLCDLIYVGNCYNVEFHIVIGFVCVYAVRVGRCMSYWSLGALNSRKLSLGKRLQRFKTVCHPIWLHRVAYGFMLHTRTSASHSRRIMICIHKAINNCL